MAFTTVPAAGVRLTAGTLSALITELRAVTAAKAAATDRNTTTTDTADPELLVALAANRTYDVPGNLLVSSAANAAGDFKYSWSYPAGATVTMGGIGPHNSLASGSQVDGEFTYLPPDATSPTASIPYGCSIAGVSIPIRARVVMGSTAGNLTLLWSQLASNANNTSVLAGSWITAYPVA